MDDVQTRETQSSSSSLFMVSDDNLDKDVTPRSRSGSTDSTTRSSLVDFKTRNKDKREMIFKELMKTERDYITDMEFCMKTFMTNPEEEKRNGIDVDILFGHLSPIITVSKKLYKTLEGVSSQPIENRQIGHCFLELADEMKEAYANYCCDHDAVIQLLEKLDENKTVSAYIRQKLESGGGCSNNQIFFSLSSLVIKPIQRITKYPLLLNELTHVTEETSNDNPELNTALYAMTDVANAINEFKRRKDLVLKYRKDPDASISSKLAKLNLHSVVKKSGRIGMRLSSSLGLVSVTKDWTFNEEEKKFREIERIIKQLLLDIETFIAVNKENVLVRLRLAENIGDFYDEERTQKIIDNFRTIQRNIASTYWPDFKRALETRVTEPLINLLGMFEGPTNLIDKRIDKLLDYDRASQRLEKNKDSNYSKVLRDELEATKKNFTALNLQLIEELPKLTNLATEIFVHCVGAFIYARSKYIGVAARQLLELAESMPNLDLTTDILDSFIGSHRLLINRMIGLGLILPDTNLVFDEHDSRKAGETSNKVKPEAASRTPQSSSQKAYLQGRYQPNQLYTASYSYSSTDQVEVSLNEGDMVAVLVQKDPMGNSDRWFIDNGSTKGLVPAKFLSPCNFSETLNAESSTPEKVDKYYEGLNPKQGNNSQNSRTPSPYYHQLDGQYEELNENDFHRYCEINPPPPYEAVAEAPNTQNTYEPSTPTTNLNNYQYYRVAFDFRATGSLMLGVDKGQIVLVLQKEDMEGNSEWWLIQDQYHRQGFVPGNYLLKYNPD